MKRDPPVGSTTTAVFKSRLVLSGPFRFSALERRGSVPRPLKSSRPGATSPAQVVR